MAFLGSLMMLAASLAPAMASDPALACNKWQRNLAVTGDFIKEVEQPDPHWCRKQCMLTDGCEASTFIRPGQRQGKVRYLDAPRSASSLAPINTDLLLTS